MRAVDQRNAETSVDDEGGREGQAAKDASRRAVWVYVLLPVLALRVLLELLGLITFYYVQPLLDRRSPVGADLRGKSVGDALWLMWRHFDSGYYLWIAHDGYAGADTLHSATNWAFFPLYPLVVHLVAAPFGSGWGVYYAASCLISTLATLVAAFYLYKITEMELDSRAAGRAVLYLLLFPLSFYLFAIYPESLFLALLISAIYYARLRRWWLAGLLGGLAALTRPTGVLIVVALAWEYWQWRAEQFAPLAQTTGLVAGVREWLRSRVRGLWLSLASWRTWSGFGALALVPFGLFLFFLYAKLKVGTFQAYFMTERYGWNRAVGNPVRLLLTSLQHPVAASPYEWNFYSLNVLCIILFFALLIPVFRRLPTIYGVLMLSFLLMPLTSGKLDSLARYYLTVFPVYMLLAWWSGRGDEERRTLRHQLILIPCTLLLAVGMVLFTLGVYSMA